MLQPKILLPERDYGPCAFEEDRRVKVSEDLCKVRSGDFRRNERCGDCKSPFRARVVRGPRSAAFLCEAMGDEKTLASAWKPTFASVVPAGEDTEPTAQSRSPKDARKIPDVVRKARQAQAIEAFKGLEKILKAEKEVQGNKWGLRKKLADDLHVPEYFVTELKHLKNLSASAKKMTLEGDLAVNVACTLARFYQPEFHMPLAIAIQTKKITVELVKGNGLTRSSEATRKLFEDMGLSYLLSLNV